MEWIKAHIREIVIVLLVLFSLSKCTQSCNRATEIDQKTMEITALDSTLKVANDSINSLNTVIKVYEEKVAGLNQSLSIQDEANKRISEAKKNINVNVKK